MQKLKQVCCSKNPYPFSGGSHSRACDSKNLQESCKKLGTRMHSLASLFPSSCKFLNWAITRVVTSSTILVVICSFMLLFVQNTFLDFLTFVHSHSLSSLKKVNSVGFSLANSQFMLWYWIKVAFWNFSTDVFFYIFLNKEVVSVL